MDYLKVLISKIIYGGGVLFDLTKWLVFVLIIISIVNTFFFAIFIVDGASMEPNLHDKEWIFWDKNAYTSKVPERDDIVVINYPGDISKKYVKRVIGLPGDSIEIREGLVYLNREKLTEQFLSSDLTSEPNGVWNLSDNQYFVMGDNRPNSNDSRYFGPVEKRFILGQAISIIYPRFRLTKDI